VVSDIIHTVIVLHVPLLIMIVSINISDTCFFLYLMEYKSHFLTVYSAARKQDSGDDA